MRRLNWMALGLALAAFLHAVPAQAISLDFIPDSLLAAVGDTFDLNVVVLDLGGEVVSGYDFDVLFDASLLDPYAVTFGTSLGDVSLFETFQFAVISAAAVNLRELSLLSDAELAALQSEPVTLATISFEVIAQIGQQGTELTFGAGESGFIDIKGRNAAVLDVDPGVAHVSPIPEPTAAILFGVGTLVVGGVLRRR